MIDRDHDLKTARKLLARAVDPQTPRAEAENAFKQFRDRVERSGLERAELLTAEDGRPMTLEQLFVVGERVKDVASHVRAVAADPDVRAAAQGIGQALKSGAELVSKLRGKTTP